MKIYPFPHLLLPRPSVFPKMRYVYLVTTGTNCDPSLILVNNLIEKMKRHIKFMNEIFQLRQMTRHIIFWIKDQWQDSDRLIYWSPFVKVKRSKITGINSSAPLSSLNCLLQYVKKFNIPRFYEIWNGGLSWYMFW